MITNEMTTTKSAAAADAWIRSGGVQLSGRAFMSVNT